MANPPRDLSFKRVVVIRGPAGSGKTVLMNALVERLNKKGFHVAASFDRGTVCFYPVGQPYYDVILVQDTAIVNPLAEVGERGMVLVYTIAVDAAVANVNRWYNPRTEQWVHARVDEVVQDLHL